MYTTPPPRHRSPESRPYGLTDVHLARVIAVFASTGAGIVHVVVTDDHWSEWPASGLFFAALSAAQLIWAMAAALSPARVLLAAGILVNAASVVLWAVSRVFGLPFGPHAGIPEAASAADVITTVLEVLVCAGAAWSLRPPRRRISSSAARAAALAGSGLVVATVTAPAVVDAAAGHSHGGGHSHGTGQTDGGHGTGHTDGHEHAPGEERPAPASPAPAPSSSGPAEAPSPSSPSSPSRTHVHDDGHTHEH